MQEKKSLEYFQEIYFERLQEKLHEHGLSVNETGSRSIYVSEMKVILEDQRERIRKLHFDGVSGAEVVYRITAWTDAVLRDLFHQSRKLTGMKKEEVQCSLLAIGGYGRGELNPYSDLDVMFFTEKEVDSETRKLAETCLYLMWDLGLDIGHSIRSLKDCVDLASSDIRAKTSLIESRFLAGDRGLYQTFLKETYKQILCRGREVYLRTKISDVNERNKKYGGSLYLKEPHLKEGVGGLRDIHTAFWIAKVKYGVNSLSELKEKGVVSEKEDKVLRHSMEFLWRVRNYLHYLSGRRNDLLSMDKQEEIAAFFDYKDFKHYLAVERFMRAYYLQTRNIRYYTSLLMNRCAPSRGMKKLFGFSLQQKKVGEGLTILGNTLCVPDDQKNYFQEKPERLMEIFVLSQRYRAPLADATKQKILASLGLVNDAFRSSDRVRELFLQVLRSDRDVVRTLREMHDLRFLGKYIPEFGAVTALVQHELYHTYTVDEHTLFALEKLEGLRRTPYPKERFYSELLQEIKRPELLFISLLFHDIGKAMGPGHVDHGGKAVPEILVRMGFPKKDVETVEFLVRNHLVMAHLSQRRDIHDPKLIAGIAQSMGSEERLNMLTLVTLCDSSAVGPTVWNEWKDTLLKELYSKTRNDLLSQDDRAAGTDMQTHLQKIRDRIREEGKEIIRRKEMDLILETLPESFLLYTPHSRMMIHLSMIHRVDREAFVTEWVHSPEKGYSELNICTYDSDTPGLFSRIAGVLASQGLNILSARIFTSYQGVLIDCVHVESPEEQKRSDPGFWSEITKTMRSVVEGSLQVKEILPNHETPSYLKRKTGRSISPRIHFDNAVSDRFTVIDVYAEDRIGLLYSITSCLARLGAYIHSSKITTEADKAIDAFYVTDIFGHKITDPEKIERLKAALLDALGEETVKRN